MPWWLWVLVWLALLIAAGAVFAAIGRSLWRKASALLVELSTAAERLGAVSEGLQKISEATADPAVFSDPSKLRQERILAARGRPGGGAANTQRTRG